MTVYKTHAPDPLHPTKVLCNLDRVQDGKHGAKVLPVASEPRFVTCENCLTHLYGDRETGH